MTNAQTSSSPTSSFWITSSVALIWNLIGIATYLASVTMSTDSLDAMPQAERALYTDIPLLVSSSYAIAVFAGTIACVALLFRKAWAFPLFVVSLVCILIQMGHALLLTPMLAVQGATSAILPLLIIAAGIYLAWYSRWAMQKGLLQ